MHCLSTQTWCDSYAVDTFPYITQASGSIIWKTTSLYYTGLRRSAPAMQFCKSTSYACFDCRKHRGLQAYAKYNRDTISCPQCQQPMKSIGCRLQVPRKDDLDGWDRFWLQFISPGYGVKGEPAIDAENEHFETCKAKKRTPPKVDESMGCEKCDAVWRRMPTAEKERWRKRRRWPWTGST